MAKRIDEIPDIMLKPKEDRRLLSHVPDPENIRGNADRRELRYETDFPVKLKARKPGGGTVNLRGTVTDISTTGLLITFPGEASAKTLGECYDVHMDFEVPPGAMPEGYEGRVKIKVKVKRQFDNHVGVELKEPLSEYLRKRKDRYTLMISSLMLFAIVLMIMLMRVESILYFRFNKFLYLYSIITASFLLSRYFIGAFYKYREVNPDFTPGVTILVPCFNEETWIDKTILGCVNQDYPIDKLEVLVIDDLSTDNSVKRIKETIDMLERTNPRFKIKERVRLIESEKNGGKREALAKGVVVAKHELIVFVDSDSFLDPYAIRNLVQPFQDPKMGGVAGRTDVANTYTNSLTKMQAVRYYIAFRIMKAAEAYFDAVTCLSGPLSCYKKQLILDNMDAWLNQRFLGQRATFGDDRSMTNFILRHHRTGYQDTAICSTIVPNRHSVFLKQQMRWKRSWLRESLLAGTFMWRKEPLMAVTFYMGLIVPIASPIVFVYNLIYVPIKYSVFPLTFLVGLFLMSALMSAAQMNLRKSSTWLYGMIFCIYYEFVLLWQMPIAWVTFWKSNWGTRMTPEDVKEEEKKKQRREKRGMAS